jgi:hypothetical protein
MQSFEFIFANCDEVTTMNQIWLSMHVYDAPPSSLMDSTSSPKMKTTKGEGVGAHSLAHNTSGVGGCAGAPR